MSNQRSIVWTPERLRRLKAAHKTAEQHLLEAFTFDPHDGEGAVEFVTSYAKYLIQYLQTRIR